MKRTRKLLALAAAIAMLGLLPQVALAQDAPDGANPTVEDREHPHAIEKAKERAAVAITRRLKALDRIDARVSASKHVTDSHKRQLAGDYARAEAGLTALGRQIEDAETWKELRELTPLIATDYRVFLVILPKSHEVIVSDRMADGVVRLTGGAAKVLEAIERAEDAGFDMTEARRFLDVARDEIDAVSNGAVPVADRVIGLSAADWEEPAKSMLQAGKAALDQGRRDIRDAVEALKSACRAIKEAIGD
ncbi:MAG: hypothetical protein DWP92_00135 [Armatimonadetes bacterium]|nr:MAG: hypothetical protein DWP92_00135 [Armatimonadota bacterium]